MLNTNYELLAENYLFVEINRRVAAYTAANPDARIIRMGIGDVTEPLCPSVCDAMRAAIDEMETPEGFRGYGPEQGYAFLREAIAAHYAEEGASIKADEVFVSDGAKSDIGNILDLFSPDCDVLIQDPVYPVYVDTNIMDGRTVTYMEATAENAYLPLPGSLAPGYRADLIYLCSPHNPCGSAYTEAQLGEWVEYACATGALILFDAAYEAFITEPDIPHSIFEIEGAEDCAIEFCSLSKTAGFTGLRCSHTAVPRALVRDGLSLRDLWLRRQTTKFNGVPYIVQRGAEAVYRAEGRRQIEATLAHYQHNARLIAATLADLGIAFTGGVNSPYIWLRCPDGMTSWDYFDLLLGKAQVVGTPGAGFGTCGEGHFRLTSFSTRENTIEAMRRLRSLYDGCQLG